ncbi:binding protein [Actinidia rufa]|uniref:Binding protein n=1 Tax=Actinidia rufa TaxID=165716 RepID=A0A7J0EE65_9ERIC|nr:binding protein [Actinidia rufa]
MAPNFIFPPKLTALEDDHDDDGSLSANNPPEILSLRPSQLEEFVKGQFYPPPIPQIPSTSLIFPLIFSPSKQASPSTSRTKRSSASRSRICSIAYFSLVKGFANLSPTCKFNLVESLRSNLSVLLPNVDSLSRASQAENDDEGSVLDRIASHRNAFKIYTFYLIHVVLIEESNISSNNISKVAASSRKKLPINSWHWELQRGRILNLIANSLEINLSLLFGSSDPDENYLSFIANLATSLIREIGRSNPKDYVKDTVGAENIGRFLVELADRLPKLISTNIGLLVPHFAGESYKIRNALVGVLGKLVGKALKDVEGEVSSKSNRLRTKQAMLEILVERCRDVSAYTRSRVLQVWAELCEEHSISIGLWNEVATVAAGRLEDKSAIVRKSALNLLIMMLQHNPFGPQLRIASFEATLEQYKKKLKELEPNAASESILDGISSDNDTCNGDGEVDNVDTEVVSKEHPESLTDSCLPHVEGGINQEDSSVPDLGNLEQTRTLVASLEAGLRFSQCVSSTMPTLVQLMASASATDVENTILLLMRCKQFQIDGSEACLRKMLPLIQNIGDLAALEFIVGALVSKGDITASMISALWDFFCFNISGTSAEQSRGALSVLCMAAKSSTGILGSHLQDIIDIGFGRWAKVEPLLARTACLALQRLSEEDKKKLLLSNGSRVFGLLESLVTGFWLPENGWYAAADKAIGAVYAIHPRPETLAADLVKKSLRSVFNCSGGEMSCEMTLTMIQKEKSKKEKLDTEGQNVQNNSTAAVDASKDNSINAELGIAASEDAMLDTLSERTEKEIVSLVVKGYIYEMAMRLEDEDDRISNLAKLFFHELSKKGNNPIYNLLPDMLGKLSNVNLKRESFCNIMQFLIGSIKKDKQMEALVEKLCIRFGGVTDGRQWEYISYCLSQLAFTEKSMKKLIESFKTYEHVLSEDSVMDNFRNIINKTKKFAKPELKSCIEEFEEKLVKFHIEKKEQERTAQNAETHKQKLSSLENFVAAKNGEDSSDSEIVEEAHIYSSS